MKAPKHNEMASTDIDMTPMIDIVFQLLTFFMVVINFDAAELDERVKMANSALARPPVAKPEHEVTLQIGYERDKNGKIIGAREKPFVFYNGESLTVENTRKFLAAEAKYFRDRNKIPKTSPLPVTVVLRADQFCPVGRVQDLIAMCRDLGYEKYSLKAENDPNKSNGGAPAE